MMTRELGVTYMGPDSMLFVVVEVRDDGVRVMVLQDNPTPYHPKPIAAGTLLTILEETAFWEQSVPFASLPEGGKVSS